NNTKAPKTATRYHLFRFLIRNSLPSKCAAEFATNLECRIHAFPCQRVDESGCTLDRQKHCGGLRPTIVLSAPNGCRFSRSCEYKTLLRVKRAHFRNGEYANESAKLCKGT